MHANDKDRPSNAGKQSISFTIPLTVTVSLGNVQLSSGVNANVAKSEIVSDHTKKSVTEDPASGSRPRSTKAASRPVVDYRTVQKWLQPFTQEATSEESASRANSNLTQLHAVAQSIADPRERGKFVSETTEALRELQEATDEVDLGVLMSPRNQLASLLQSKLDHRVATSESLEFPFDNDDVKTVLQELRDHSEHQPKHPIQRPESEDPDELPDSARVFLAADYGTGMYGAPVTAATVLAENKKYDLLMHLGDIYYSGQPDEVQSRFLDVWPKKAGKISRTLNGNHDMYSGGFGYFDHALPAFGQSSSYFAFQNADWLLLGLDTAWLDNDLEEEQVDWIYRMVDQCGSRKVVLFSHHPLFSNFKKEQGTKLAAKLNELLSNQRVFAWYWGHEHHCIIYDEHPVYKLKARCLGHGGMPAKRKDLADLKIEKQGENFAWRRLKSDLTPNGLCLDGPNEFIAGHESKYLPHGYMTLHFDGNQLVEKVRSPLGLVLYKATLG